MAEAGSEDLRRVDFQAMTDVGRRSFFDHMAEGATTFGSRAPFFASCVLLIVIWFPMLFLMSLDMSQLIINTLTTIITFLLVALLENSNARANKALQLKLDATTYGLRDLMEHVNHVMPCDVEGCDFADDTRKLQADLTGFQARGRLVVQSPGQHVGQRRLGRHA
jgi:low affinity Fe/Cu permease